MNLKLNPSKASKLYMFKSPPKFIGGNQNLCRYFNHVASVNTDIGNFFLEYLSRLSNRSI